MKARPPHRLFYCPIALALFGPPLLALGFATLAYDAATGRL